MCVCVLVFIIVFETNAESSTEYQDEAALKWRLSLNNGLEHIVSSLMNEFLWCLVSSTPMLKARIEH